MIFWLAVPRYSHGKEDLATERDNAGFELLVQCPGIIGHQKEISRKVVIWPQEAQLA